MNFDELVKKRKSVRSFKKKSIDWRDILLAIDAAQQGPFAGNNNNLRYIIIEKKETIEKIAELADQLWISEAPVLIIVCSNEIDLENQYGERGRIYNKQQAGAAIQTILFKLVDLKLSACWVGSYDDFKIRLLLKIPKEVLIEAIIPVGYESGNTHKKEKRTLENHIFWEEWNKKKRPAIFEEAKDPTVLIN